MDHGDRDVRMQAGGWAIILGAVGFGLGGMLSMVTGTNPLLAGVIGAVVAGGGVYAFVLSSTGAAGGIARRIYAPEGDTTQPVREYSEAQALVHNGHYEDAIEAYELHHLRHAEDPEPCIRLGRLYRDVLEDYPNAGLWLKKARQAAGVTRSGDLMISQELIELYKGKMRQPAMAMPELARLLDQFADSPGAPVAARELAQMRELMQRADADGVPFESLYYEEGAVSSDS